MVKHITRRLLYVSSISEQGVRPETHALRCVDFKFDLSDVSVYRRQFHIHLAFSATVRRIQGPTLRGIVVNIRSNFFSSGQFYLALSRASKAHYILLLNKEEDIPFLARSLHRMAIPINNPVLWQAIQFEEGDH